MAFGDPDSGSNLNNGGRPSANRPRRPMGDSGRMNNRPWHHATGGGPINTPPWVSRRGTEPPPKQAPQPYTPTRDTSGRPLDNTGTIVQENYNPNDSMNNMRFNGLTMVGGGNYDGTVPKAPMPATGGDPIPGSNPLPLGDPNQPLPQVGSPFGPIKVIDSAPQLVTNNGQLPGGWEEQQQRMRQF